MSLLDTTLPDSTPKPINGVHFDSLDVILNQTLSLTCQELSYQEMMRHPFR
jgi:hypothetical protein